MIRPPIDVIDDGDTGLMFVGEFALSDTHRRGEQLSAMDEDERRFLFAQRAWVEHQLELLPARIHGTVGATWHRPGPDGELVPIPEDEDRPQLGDTLAYRFDVREAYAS